MFRRIVQRLPHLWYQRRLSSALLPLLPFSWLFRLIVGLRQWLYRSGVLPSYLLPVPVIVVGNLTVGGSGKTPLVLWLVEHLRENGWRPGVISRGYGGTAQDVQSVAVTSNSSAVGDEPLLLARRSGVPVFIGRDRVAAGHALLAEHPDCDVIVSDDGLQHYRLQRTVEIAVFDGRSFGNRRLLPAGPLREQISRLKTATALVWNAAEHIATDKQALCGSLDTPQFTMRLVGQRFYALADAQRCCYAAELGGKRLHALAGIGDPSRFFSQLEVLGLEFEAHPFPDHHAYSASDIAFARDGVLLMTEKDAVKCAPLLAITAMEAWVLPVEAQIDAASDGQLLLNIISEKCNGRTPA